MPTAKQDPLKDPFAGLPEAPDPFSQEELLKARESMAAMPEEVLRPQQSRETVVQKEQIDGARTSSPDVFAATSPEVPAGGQPQVRPQKSGRQSVKSAQPTQIAQPASPQRDVTSPTQQASVQQPPVVQRFFSYLDRSPALRQAWEAADAKRREAIIDKFIRADVNKRLEQLQKSRAFARLKSGDKSRLLRTTFNKYYAAAKLQAQAALVQPTTLSDTPLELLDRVARDTPTRADEIMARFQRDMKERTRLRNFWTRSSAREQEDFLKKYTRANIIGPALMRLRQSKEYRRLSPKQQKLVETRLRERLQLEADKAFLGITGSMPEEIIQDETAPDKVGAMSQPHEDPGWIEALTNSAMTGLVSGSAGLVAGVGDLVGLVSPETADSAVFNWARRAAEQAQKDFNAGLPAEERQTLEDVYKLFGEQRYGTAFTRLITNPEAMLYLGANMLGWAAGSGGAAGAARAAAAKSAAIIGAKLAGRAVRLGRVTGKASTALKSRTAARTATTAGLSVAAGAQAGEDAYQQVKAMPVDKLRLSPAWLKQQRALAAALGRQPTDAEVQEAMARAARYTATTLGTGASAASYLIFGAVPENLLLQPLSKLGLAEAGRTSADLAARSIPGAVITGAAREAGQEFIESGGQGAAAAYAAGRQPGEAARVGVQQGIAGAILGGTMGSVFGGLHGLRGRYSGDRPINSDPDIKTAQEGVQAANAATVRAALEVANVDDAMKGDTITRVTGSLSPEGDLTIELGDNSRIERKGGIWYRNGQEVNPAEDPAVATTLTVAEHSLGLKPGTLINVDDVQAAQETLKATEATTPTEEAAGEPNAAVDAELAGKPLVPPDTIGKPVIDVAEMPEDALRLAVLGYMKTLLDAGEPFLLAKNSAAKTFGAKHVNPVLKELSVDKSQAQLEEEIRAIDLSMLSEDLRKTFGIEGDPRHTTTVQKALREGGVYEGVIVVNDAGEMPGMRPDLPLATFTTNDGKGSFTVLNAAAVPRMSQRRMRGYLKQLVIAHELGRSWLEKGTFDKVYAAAVDLMTQLNKSIAYETKSGRFQEVSPARASQFLSERGGELKARKTVTSEAVYKWFVDELRRGSTRALQAVKRVMKGQGLSYASRLPLPQLHRMLVESGVLPATDGGTVMAMPPTRRGVAREAGPVNPPPRRRNVAIEARLKAAEKAEAGDGKPKKPPLGVINLTGYLLRAVKFTDDNALIKALEGVAKKMPDGTPGKDPLLRFTQAVRGRSSRINHNLALAQELVWLADAKAEELAQRAGYDDVQTFKNEYMLYRLARHALERNPVLHATHATLRTKEAVQERQTLMNKILRGEAGAETMWERLIELAREHGEESPDTIYAGLSNQEAEDIIRQAKRSGKATIFEELDPYANDLANYILKWRVEAGTYAGSALNVIRSYNWKYYTPLINVNKTGEKFEANDEINLLESIFNAPSLRSGRGKKKQLAEGRVDIEGIGWDGWYVEARNAARAAANAEVARTMLDVLRNQEGMEIGLGDYTSAGRLEYKSEASASGGPGWKAPRVSEANPAVLGVYDPEEGDWKRMVIADPELARITRNDFEDDAFLNARLMRKAGVVTRIYGRTYTTFRPAFLATSFIRDVIQTGLLGWSQEGINPIKFTAKTLSSVAGVAMQNSHIRALARFANATPREKERLASDPEFLKLPGAKHIVDRWRRGGWITFADYIAESGQVEKSAALKDIEQTASPFRRWAQKVRKRSKFADKFFRALEAPDQVMTVLDNLHRQIAYNMMVENGADPAKAAAWSRNLMDFNRRSKWGRRINTFYAFSQAGFTGIGTMIDNHIWTDGVPPLKVEYKDGAYKLSLDRERALEKFNWKLAGTLILMGATSVMLNYMLLGEDEDGSPKADAIHPGTWMNYFITPIGTFGPDGNSPAPVKIPMQYGPSQLFYGLGVTAALRMMGRDWHDISYAYFNQLLKNALPIGTPVVPEELVREGDISLVDAAKATLVAFSPTVLTPPIEVLTNRNVFGGTVHKNIRYTSGKPPHELGFIGTPELWSGLAETANDMLGKVGIKPSVQPEDVELLVRDFLPIIGPIFAAGPRAWLSFFERPERTRIESILTSGLVPFPGLILDHRYKHYDLERRLRARYVQPAKEALKATQAMRDGPEKERALTRVYRRFPFLREVRKLDQNFGRRLQKMRDAIRKARARGDHVTAERRWLAYQEMQRLRTRKLVEILKRYGIEP